MGREGEGVFEGNARRMKSMWPAHGRRSDERRVQQVPPGGEKQCICTIEWHSEELAQLKELSKNGKRPVEHPGCNFVKSFVLLLHFIGTWGGGRDRKEKVCWKI